MTNKDKKLDNEFKRTAKISVRACCFINPRLVSPPYQNLSPPTDYQMGPSPSPIMSPPLLPIVSPGISPGELLSTPKSTPPPLTSPPPAPSQPSKQSSPFAINLDVVELIFSTPPTSPHPFFDSLEDLPLKTTNPPPPRPTFESIECLANQPPPLPSMEPQLPMKNGFLDSIGSGKKKKNNDNHVLDQQSRSDTVNLDNFPMLSGLASKVQNMEGQMVGPDCNPLKPYDGMVFVSILGTNEYVGGVSNDLSGTNVSHDTSLKVAIETVTDMPTNTDKENFQALNTGKPNNAKAKVQIQKSSILEAHAIFGFSLYVYFGGKRVAFSVVEYYVKNVWKKYGIELKEEMVIAIPNVEDDGEVFHSVRVDYEWKPPRCGMCMIFGHDDKLCLKWVVGIPMNDGFRTDKGTKKEGQSVIHIVDKINVLEKQILECKLVLVDDDRKPLEKVDYPGDLGNDDEVEPVDNEMTTFLELKWTGICYARVSIIRRYDGYEFVRSRLPDMFGDNNFRTSGLDKGEIICILARHLITVAARGGPSYMQIDACWVMRKGGLSSLRCKCVFARHHITVADIASLSSLIDCSLAAPFCVLTL
ncbi:hypothetical protein Tco_0583759 [Tanacetum coccineum]